MSVVVTPQLSLGLDGFYPCDDDKADELLVEWGHYLGPCERPFGKQSWVLTVNSIAVSVAVSASAVSKHMTDDEGRILYRRGEVVELARLCTDPTERWATRVMLRYWREVLAHRWPHWPAKAAIAYSQNDRHDGRIYRFDGWERVRGDCGSSGGGTWSKQRVGDDEATGDKTLWLWRYDAGESQWHGG